VLLLVPPTGSARRPRPSLHRLLRGEFAGFPGTMTRCDSLPPFRRASLPSLGDTRRCVGTFAPGGPERPTAGQGFIFRPPLPDFYAWRWSGPPRFPESPHCPFAMFFDAGRTAAPDQYGAATWPLVCEQQRLPRKVFRRSIAWLSDSLFTLRRTGYPATTQNSLPAVGQTLLDGLFTRRAPTKGFRMCRYTSSSLPELCLAQSYRPPNATRQPASVAPTDANKRILLAPSGHLDLRAHRKAHGTGSMLVILEEPASGTVKRDICPRRGRDRRHSRDDLIPAGR
jgi:hypothetical protein